MTESTSPTSPQPATMQAPDVAGAADAAGPPATLLRVDRVAARRYVGTSTRGGRVEIGSADVEGVFTPGELLKIALGACSAMASDFTVSRRLGDDFDATVHISGDADRETERYPVLEELYELDMSELDPAGAERLVAMVQRSIDKACTVGRTLQAGTEIRLGIQTGHETP